MTNIELKDFLKYSYLSSPVAVDDGIVLVEAKADEKENRYDRYLYHMKADGSLRKLTYDGRMSVPVYFDGAVYFTADREEKKEEKKTRIYRLPLDGGEAQLSYEIGRKVTSFRLLQDGNLLVTYTDDIRGEMGEEKEKLWEEIEEFPFYHNGGSFSANTYTRLAIFESRTRKLYNLTEKGFALESYDLDEEEKKVTVVGKKRRPSYDIFSDILEIDIHDKSRTRILKKRAWDINWARYFGGKILVLASDTRKCGINQNPNFYLLEQGEMKLFAIWEEAVYNSVGSDARLGGGRNSEVVEGRLYFTTTLRDRSLIMCLDQEGKLSKIRDEEGSVDSFCFSSGHLYSIEMRRMGLEEVYIDGERKSDFNTSLLSEKKLGVLEEFTFMNKDGIELDGYVIKPTDYEAGRKYPCILDIHGGPKTIYGKVYYHEMQLWANKGYFVIYTNPRGSDGRGIEFSDIRGKYGTIDYSDIMEFVAEALKRYPDIDREKVGATGGSYGGFMCNWILGHTDFFKAIATQRSISNWISMWGTSDIGTYFVDDQNDASLLEGDFDKLLEHSPLPYIVKYAKTPTLIIHSDEDYRCPVEQGYQLLTALVTKKVEARLVLFHGENHELSRSGRPKCRIKRLEEITSWFERHLK